MNKRLEKRHKRQVTRARERIRISEPDVRTPEQVRAARAASQPAGGLRAGPPALYISPASPAGAAPPAGEPAKTEE